MSFNLFLQAPGGGFDPSTLIFFGLMIAVFYFFMIRPQQKKQKDAKAFRDNLKKGDEVVTIGGLHGVISSVESDDTITVEIDRGVKIKVEKWGISADATKKTDTTKK